MAKQEEFLELIEKNNGEVGKDMKLGLEIHLRRTKQKILDYFPVTESEHNWFDGPPNEGNLRRILNGYELVVENENGQKRYVGYAYFAQELYDYWKKESEKRKAK